MTGPDDDDEVWRPAPYKVPVLHVDPKQRTDAGAAASSSDTVEDMLNLIDAAKDGRDIMLVLQKPLAKSIIADLAGGRVGASDKIKLLNAVNDRVDGKVADVVRVELTAEAEGIGAITELLRAGVLNRETALQQARDIGIKDMGFIYDISNEETEI